MIVPTMLSAADLHPRINELMASNSSVFEDGNGEYPDWIEFYNPNPKAMDLGGYYLTDDADAMTKWRFPSVEIPAEGYLLVMASDPVTQEAEPISDFIGPDGWAHATFNLDVEGEYLALVGSDGERVIQEFAPKYPRQRTDVSYGYEQEEDEWGYFRDPTPGASNGSGYPGFVADTTFSVDRGFYEDPFEVEITSETSGAVIYYTLDGRPPGPETGSVYQGPIVIDGTTTLRAKAVREGLLPTNIDTQTYLFIEDVVHQPPDPEGYPSHWGTDNEVPGRVVADYEMDRRVVNGAKEGYSVREGLLDIPTLSIVMAPEDFFGRSQGIYTHPKNRGDAWEKACSLELIHPDGEEGFQVNAQIEIHGNSSRRPWRMQKHSLRVSFLSRLGPARLEYPLFADSSVTSFDELVLRAGFTDSWGLVSWAPGRYRPNDSQYIRDVWMKESLRDMGQPSSHGNFVHLYVNGLYWGLYNPTERLEVEFFADHFGGRTEDWRVIQDFENTSPGWLRMFQIARWNPESPEMFETIQDYLDVANFADYMLLHFYADAEDWPHHNGYAARREGEPFRFWVWDQEIALDNHRMRRYDASHSRTPGELFQLLRQNREFRMLFADRAQKHLFQDGALSLEASQARYRRLAEEIDKAIVAESARWGDTQMSTPYGNRIEQPADPNDRDDLNYPPAPQGPDYYFTREDSWRVERENVLSHYLPEIYNSDNPNSLLRELRAENLFPEIDAPTFSKHGGYIAPGFELQLTAPEGEIYYTLDGTDPRAAGEPEEASPSDTPAPRSPQALVYSDAVTLTRTVTVKTRAFDGTEWSALNEARFVTAQPASAENLVISEIHYHPQDYGDAEFIELMNIGSASVIDLKGVVFADGISFVFESEQLLGPGERLILVQDREIFASVYGSGVSVAGEYDLALSNGGETLLLQAADGRPIQHFAYSPDAPWPVAADGNGSSLMLKAPYSNPNPNLPGNWRASRTPGGTPGKGDPGSRFSGDPEADPDGDGMPALMEYALGTSDTHAESEVDLLQWEIRSPDDESEPGPFLYLTLPRNPAATDVALTLQTSTDLDEWSDEGEMVFVEERSLEEDRVERIYRSLLPLERLKPFFVRLKAHNQNP